MAIPSLVVLCTAEIDDTHIRDIYVNNGYRRPEILRRIFPEMSDRELDVLIYKTKSIEKQVLCAKYGLTKIFESIRSEYSRVKNIDYRMCRDLLRGDRKALVDVVNCDNLHLYMPYIYESENEYGIYRAVEEYRKRHGNGLYFLLIACFNIYEETHDIDILYRLCSYDDGELTYETLLFALHYSVILYIELRSYLKRIGLDERYGIIIPEKIMQPETARQYLSYVFREHDARDSKRYADNLLKIAIKADCEEAIHLCLRDNAEFYRNIDVATYILDAIEYSSIDAAKTLEQYV